MNATLRRFGLSCLALGLVACNTQMNTVHTCAFGTDETACTPVLASEAPRNVIDMHFTLVNPNAPAQGCAGEFHLGVNAPRNWHLIWHAREQDPATCAQIGEEMSGDQLLDEVQNGVDAHFPQGDFTFRVVVRPEGE
jgi:hypothetical protein